MTADTVQEHLAELEQLDQLSFARTATGRVHVERWWDQGPHRELVPGDGLLRYLLHGPRCVTLCGQEILCEPHAPGPGWVSEFDDRDLCEACRTLLGPYGYRAFEHSQPPGAIAADGATISEEQEPTGG